MIYDNFFDWKERCLFSLLIGWFISFLVMLVEIWEIRTKLGFSMLVYILYIFFTRAQSRDVDSTSKQLVWCFNGGILFINKHKSFSSHQDELNIWERNYSKLKLSNSTKLLRQKLQPCETFVRNSFWSIEKIFQSWEEKLIFKNYKFYHQFLGKEGVITKNKERIETKHQWHSRIFSAYHPKWMSLERLNRNPNIHKYLICSLTMLSFQPLDVPTVEQIDCCFCVGSGFYNWNHFLMSWFQ